MAAGASSSVAAQALIAAAADAKTTPEEVGLVDAAYFPPIGALTVLLDDLVDRDEDVKQKGPERLAELVPWAVYITLTPFVGAEEAYVVATGGESGGNAA